MNVIGPFTAARLAQLYTSHGDYYAKYKKAVQEFRKEGFLFPEDAEKLLAKAAAVPIPG